MESSLLYLQKTFHTAAFERAQPSSVSGCFRKRGITLSEMLDGTGLCPFIVEYSDSLNLETHLSKDEVTEIQKETLESNKDTAILIV
ncbi:hypothetical protein NPIL_585041 [Nephila pilipes]|uniref:Uncharacterized protein n=1 Tax=Nephila pilipes TaxID=299642 RepID=A0A8X6QII4_NEPPI|nr:hypothetical protein NPIL_585041 [Nephila pilipes]